MFFGKQEIKLLHLAQPFSSKFHSISDGSNRYCCIQIHSCGMIFLLQFFFPITRPPQHILHGSFKLLFLFFPSIFFLSLSPTPLSLVRAFLILYLLHIFLCSFPYQYYIFRIAVSVFIFLRIAVSVFLRKFYMAFLSEKAFPSTCMHLYTKVGEKITGGWCLHSRRRFTRAHT